MAKIKIKFKMEPEALKRKKWELHKLADLEVKQRFQLQIKNRFCVLEDEVDTREMDTDALIQHTNNIIPRFTSPPPPDHQQTTPNIKLVSPLSPIWSLHECSAGSDLLCYFKNDNNK